MICISNLYLQIRLEYIVQKQIKKHSIKKMLNLQKMMKEKVTGFKRRM